MPCATQSNNQARFPTNGVAAYIDVKYHPAQTDPKPGQKKLYWIQFIYNNHSKYDENGISTGEGVHGLTYEGLDIPLNQAEPYYRGNYPKESGDFGLFDRPYRRDYDQPHQWVARSFLVEEVAPKTVVVYNGIQWGWENRIYPNNNNSCPNPSLRTVSGGTNITTSSSVDSMDALQVINCPTPEEPSPPPEEPSPPPDEPSPPPVEQCTSIDSMQLHDLCFSANVTKLYARMKPNTTYTAMYYNCYPWAATAVSDSTGLVVFDFVNPVRGGISDCGPVAVNMNIYSGNDINTTPILSVYTGLIPTTSW